MRILILILFVLALLGMMLAPRQDASGFDGGYPPPIDVTPTALGYPAPAPTVDPWCEEAMLMGMPLPWWCPVIGEAVETVVDEPEALETPTPAAMKTGGRAKGKQ